MDERKLKRLDPQLRNLLRKMESVGQAPGLRTTLSGDKVDVLIEFRGDRADLERVGLTFDNVGQHPDGSFIGTGVIDPSRLRELAAIEHVIAVDGGGSYRPELNHSVAEIHARDLRIGFPPIEMTGQGAIVGVIDSGFDWRHGVFSGPDNKTRVLAIWDQNLTALAGETAGPGNLGVIYRTAAIDAALADTSLVETVRTRDTEVRHGTAVAAVAAGDGSPAGCATLPNTYVGIATRANLIVVAHKFDDTLGESANLSRALNFIFKEAGNTPCVVNISLGGDLGAHDGTSMVEREIDQLVLAQAGRVVVKSAGNEGATNRHVKASIPQKTSARPHEEVIFTVAKDDRSTRVLDFWYESAHQLSFEIITPDGVTSGVVAHGADKAFSWNPSAPAADQGQVLVDATPNAPHSGDHNIRITIFPTKSRYLPAGQWKLRVSNSQPATAELHGWSQRDKRSPLFLPPDTDSSQIRASRESTITIPGTAKEVITVANWAGRESDCDCCPKREIHESSSRGPLRKNAQNNPKPNFAAPGEMITTAYADSCQLPGNCCDCCSETWCQLYDSYRGTSLAAPHVTGAIALMFQLDKTLSKQRVVELLEQTAERPDDADRNAWGSGLINVHNALRRTVGLPTPIHGPRQVQREAPLRALQPPVLVAARACLEQLPEGRRCTELFSRHFSEVRRLINSNRKVATLWHRAAGPKLIARVAAGVLDATAPDPIADVKDRRYLERMVSQLHRYGSARLRASIERNSDLIFSLIATPLAAQATRARSSAS